MLLMVRMANYKKTPREIALEESATPREYYYKLLNAKKNGESWARELPVDIGLERIDQNKCPTCGKPDMSEQMTGCECKRCGIQRLIYTYGYSKETAEQEYEHRLQRKEERLKLKELVKHKKVSEIKRDDIEDLPF